MRQIRRLAELTPKKIKNKKIKKKSIIRMLSENNTEIVSESEILPFEKEIDLKLRQIDKNSDNSSNITLISYEDVADEKAKLKGSLDKGEVFTNINDKGIVSSIYQSRNTELISGYKDEVQDNYVKDNAYIDTAFDEGMFEIEDETKKQEELSFKMESMSSNNTNLIDLVDDLADDNGTIIEYFSSIKYEKYDDSVFEKYILEEMGTQFSDEFNSSNVSISTEEYDENTNSLRNLKDLKSEYPYFGEDIIKNIQDIYKKDMLGATFYKYIDTTQYPHNGTTINEIVIIIGSEKKIFSRETTISNSNITTRNKNMMTNKLVKSLDKAKFNDIAYNIKSKFYAYENEHLQFVNNKGYKFGGLGNKFDNLLSRFWSASNFNFGNIKKVQNLIKKQFDYIYHTCNQIFENLHSTIYDFYFFNRQPYDEAIDNLYTKFSDLINYNKDLSYRFNIELMDISIFNLIYKDLQPILPILLKEAYQIKKQKDDSYKELKKQLLNYKEEMMSKVKIFVDQLNQFAQSFQEKLDKCDDCLNIEENIHYLVGFIVDSADNYFYGIETNIRRYELDYYVETFDDEGFLKKHFEGNLESFNNSVNFDLMMLNEKYSDYNRYIFDMKEDLNFLYEQLNTLFFENLKDNIDNLYNTIIKFKGDFLDNYYLTINKLSYYSNEFFSIINEKMPEDQSKMDTYSFYNSKKIIENNLWEFYYTISDYLNSLKGININTNFYSKEIDEKANHFLWEIEFSIFAGYKIFFEPQYRQIEIIENYFSKLFDYKEYLNNLTEILDSTLLELNYLDNIINIFLSSLSSFIYRCLDRIYRIERDSIYYADDMYDMRELFNDLYEKYP